MAASEDYNGSSKSGLAGVKHIILILSGKGGVGKSTVAAQLALSIRHLGLKVGLLDVDLCGPSIPFIMNLEDKDVHQCTEGWVPVFIDQQKTLAVMSIAFLLNNRNDAVVWRGPKKNALIKQFLKDVIWQDIDYLIIDTPPGTSDEHITVVESIKHLKPDGSILITTPQAVSTGDVRREITFCKKAGIPLLGIIENMAGFVCPNCSECTDIFSRGGGEVLAKQADVPFLGSIPLDPLLTQSLDKGQHFVDVFQDSATSQVFLNIAQCIMKEK